MRKLIMIVFAVASVAIAQQSRLVKWTDWKDKIVEARNAGELTDTAGGRWPATRNNKQPGVIVGYNAQAAACTLYVQLLAGFGHNKADTIWTPLYLDSLHGYEKQFYARSIRIDSVTTASAQTQDNLIYITHE